MAEYALSKGYVLLQFVLIHTETAMLAPEEDKIHAGLCVGLSSLMFNDIGNIMQPVQQALMECMMKHGVTLEGQPDALWPGTPEYIIKIAQNHDAASVLEQVTGYLKFDVRVCVLTTLFAYTLDCLPSLT